MTHKTFILYRRTENPIIQKDPTFVLKLDSVDSFKLEASNLEMLVKQHLAKSDNGDNQYGIREGDSIRTIPVEHIKCDPVEKLYEQVSAKDLVSYRFLYTAHRG